MHNTLTLSEPEKSALITCLNCELRQHTGESARHLNRIFRALVGRDHEMFARHWPEHCSPPESWYVKKQ